MKNKEREILGKKKMYREQAVVVALRHSKGILGLLKRGQNVHPFRKHEAQSKYWLHEAGGNVVGGTVGVVG